MSRGIGKSNNRKKEVGLYLETMQSQVENNEELFLQLENTDDDEQKAEIIDTIFRNNLRAIHSVIYRRYGTRLQDILQRNRMTYGDIYSIGCDTLWRAIDKFDINLGFKFVTLLYKMLHNAFGKYFQRLKTPDSNLSIETPMYNNQSDASEITLLDMITLETEDEISQVDDMDFFLRIFEELEKECKPKDMMLIRSYLTGEYSQASLGAKFGVSQVQAGRIIKRVQAKAREIRDRISGEAV
jgi:RNA polymerase sigma factor (sigma-70 family)